MNPRPALDEETLGLLLAAAPDPLVAVDAHGVVRWVSEPTAPLLGRPAADLLGRPLAVVVPGWEAGTSNCAGRPGRVRALHHDGHSVEVELSRVPMGEGLTGVFVHDLSLRLELEAENDRLREELVGNISHELQTPLTSIIGYSELLRELDDDELGPRARRLVEVVHRNAQRELRLVEDLLAVSFPDDRLARRDDRVVDLGPLAEQVVAERRAFADGAGVELLFEVAGPALVRGDHHHLARLVEHLVVNGCAFSPPGGRVVVTLSTEADSVRLTVVDTGIGVSEQEAARLFERFYQPPSTIGRQVESAGLGLAVAKAITEAHGGSIELASRIGFGTTVTVRLHRAEP